MDTNGLRRALEANGMYGGDYSDKDLQDALCLSERIGCHPVKLIRLAEVTNFLAKAKLTTAEFVKGFDLLKPQTRTAAEPEAVPTT